MKDRRHVAPRKPAPAWNFLLVLPAALLWMELIFRLFVIERFFDVGLFLVVLFTIPIAAVVFLLCTFGKARFNRAIAIGILALFTLVFCSQIVYFGVFDTFYILYENIS